MSLTAEEQSARDALQAEYDRLVAEHENADELPDDVDERFGELETALEAFAERPLSFDPDQIGRASAFVSIAPDGRLRVERGYVRPEDERPVETEAEADDRGQVHGNAIGNEGEEDADAEADISAPEPEDEGLSPISDRLMTELTAHRTLGLRHALGEQPQVAFHAALHTLTLKVFYHYGSDSCLELDLKSVGFGTQAPGLNDSASADAIRARHETWAKALPKDSAELWDARPGVGRRQPGNALRPCRQPVGQRRARGLEPAAARARSRRPAGAGGRTRHGGGGMAADGRRFPRPGHQGPHSPGRR